MHPETPSDPPLRELELPAGPATYTDEGTGEHVVVAFHGYPDSLRVWRWLAPALTDHVRLVRVDMPGMGGTPLATHPGRGIDDRGAFALEVLDALRLDAPPVLLAHSLASTTVVAAVAQRPDCAHAIALLAPAGLRPHWDARRGRVLRFGARVLDSPGEVLLRWPLAQTYGAMGFSKRLTHAERAHAIQSAAAMDWARMAEHVAHVGLVGRPPCMVAWCGDDALVPAEIPQELGDALPGGPRLRFESGGHGLVKTRATEIAEALVDWLDGS